METRNDPFENQFSLGDIASLDKTSDKPAPRAPADKAAPSKKLDVIVPKNGTTLTGEPADQVVINPNYDPQKLTESADSTAVMAFGRMNPPTTGHEKLIHKVEDVAKEHNGTAHIVASHSEGTSKDPLPQKAKLGYIKKIVKPGTVVSGSSKEAPSLLHIAAKLHAAGHRHLVVVAGDDRVDEYHKLLHKYNGVDAKHGHYNFKSIKIVSAGHRDPDAEGTEGMSGTKMRALAHAGKDEEFKAGLPKALHPHAAEIANHIRSAPIKEDIEQLDEVGDTAKGQKLLQMVNKRAVNRLTSKKADTDPAYAKKAQQTHWAADERLKEEQVNEISKDLANRYMYSAMSDRNQVDQKVSKAIDKNRESFSVRRHKNITKLLDKSDKRSQGIQKALDRLQKEEIEIDEAASVKVRLARAQNMRKNKAKLSRARDLARKRFAKIVALRRRALKKARQVVRRKLAGKRGLEYNKLSMSSKIALDKMVDKRKKAIKAIANKLSPRIKRDELSRLQAVMQGTKFKGSQAPIVAENNMEVSKLISEKAAAALKRKADKSGVSLQTLQQVFARGMAAYKNSNPPSVSPQQVAFARVNSYLAKGKAFNEDRDLREAAPSLSYDDMIQRGMKTPRHMSFVDFKNVKAVHGAHQHAAIAKDVSDDDEKTAARKKADIIRRTTNQWRDKILEHASTPQDNKQSALLALAQRLDEKAGK